MKAQNTEPTMDEIIFCYIKGNGRQLCHNDLHTPTETYSADKYQYNIG